jgi:predicted NBD/HSP70 family sugar kinase
VFEEGRVRVAVADLSYSFNAERSAEVRLHDVPGREGASPDEALEIAGALAEEVLAEAGIARDRVVGVGLGIPAPLDQKTGIVASDTILHRWKDVRAADQLAERLKLPVEIDNDANLGALGELLFGAGRGIDDFIYVKHSPYVGSALVIDGKLRRGATGIAGELGHIQVQPGGAICGGCGKRGCLGPIVAAAVLARLLEPSHGAGITLPQMRLLIERGDVVASRIANDAGRTIGKVLAGYCNQLNPAAIIVQGELSVSGGPLLGGIREEIDRGAIPAAAAAVTVKPTELGDRAELLGAAALVIANPERVPSSAFLRLG